MMLLSKAASILNAQHIGADALFTSVGANSRNIAQEQLFVALLGERFDGHDYAAQVIEHGAAGVLVEKVVENTAENTVPSVEPSLVVKNTYQALGELAAYWRTQFNIPIAAITGSNGKTTVKEMLASILRMASANAHFVLATEGNLNNHIGLPLTLLQLKPQHAYAVVEMGMNHRGELSYLTNIAKPTVALINNAGSAHIGELGSLEAIAHAKGEIFEGLALDGIAIVNAEDAFAPLWINLAGSRKVITFGLKKPADVFGSYQLQADASLVDITTSHGSIHVVLQTPGLHNVMNALAATAVATAMNIPLTSIARGLENCSGAKGRLQAMAGLNGALVIDDSYNANPVSMKAAIDVLKEKPGKKLLVLGDMGELGADAADLHAEIGRYAKACGIDALFTLGNLSQEMTRAFGIYAKHYAAVEALTIDVSAQMKPGTTVLVKGSRFMAMEKVIHKIIAKNNNNDVLQKYGELL